MNEDYYKELFKQHHFSLVLFATSKVGDFLAADYVQDAFLELWRLKDKGHKNPKSFLYTMVYHRCLNHLRDTGRANKNLNDIRFMLDVSEDYIEAQVTKGFYVEKLVEGINSLPERQKKVIKLYHGGYSTKEISENLDIEESTVWGQVKRFIDGFIKKMHKKSEHIEKEVVERNETKIVIIDRKKIMAEMFPAPPVKELKVLESAALERKLRKKKDRIDGHVTHCKNGHEYTKENMGTNSQGRIFCRTCKRNRARENYQPVQQLKSA